MLWQAYKETSLGLDLNNIDFDFDFNSNIKIGVCNNYVILTM